MAIIPNVLSFLKNHQHSDAINKVELSVHRCFIIICHKIASSQERYVFQPRHSETCQLFMHFSKLNMFALGSGQNSAAYEVTMLSPKFSQMFLLHGKSFRRIAMMDICSLKEITTVVSTWHRLTWASHTMPTRDCRMAICR